MMRLMILIALAGCYRDADPAPPRGIDRGPKPPPLRTMQQLLVLDTHGPEGDEHALFERVRAAYAAAGFADDAKHIELVLDDHVMVPYMMQGNVVARHFLGDGPAPREHLATISHFLYRDRLPAAAAIAFPDYRAFMTGLLCHEFAHALAFVRGQYHTSQTWLEEARAIDFERGCLADLVRANAIPADSLAAFDRFDRVLLAALPPDVLASVPANPGARAPMFDEAYPKVAEAMTRDPKRPHPEPAAVGIVLAMYAVYRGELGALVGPSIAAVAVELSR